MNQTKMTKEYRAKLTLTEPNVVVTITGSSPSDVRNAIQGCLKNRARFDSASPAQAGAGTNRETVLVFNSERDTEPVGWISELEVPQAMSAETINEYRRNQHQQRAA